MLKKRIIAVLLIKNGIVVQSKGFGRYLPVGKPSIAVEFLNQWGIDEIILLDINATRCSRPPDFDMVRRASQFCRVPLTVGGGITNAEQISELMRCGADKVALNQITLYEPTLLASFSRIFGSQCIVASIDGILTKEGFRVYDYCQRKSLSQSPAKFAKQLESYGVGEIFINSVDRDGAYTGFDVPLITEVCAAVTVPVIACGGAGNAEHFLEILKYTSVSAAAAANIFHFTEHSATTIKSQISRKLLVRHDTYFNYNDSTFDSNGRLLKKDDKLLENMHFTRIEKEII